MTMNSNSFFNLNSIHQFINDYKMKKQDYFNILLGLLLSGTFLLSCSNNDLEDKTISGTRILKVNICESFGGGSDEKTLARSEESDTIFQDYNNGLKIEAVIKRDEITDTRAVSSSVGVGVKVLAIVINDKTNEVYRIHQLTVNGTSQLECEVPDYDVRVVFYSYNSTTTIPTTSLVQGDLASTTARDNYEEGDRDVMWATTGVIKSTDKNLGQIKFKHLHARIKMVFGYSSGNLRSFKTSLESNGIRQHSIVRIISGTMVPGTQASSIDFENSIPGGSGITELPSEYYLTVPAGIESSCKLSVTQINESQLKDHFITFNKKFEPSGSYTIHFTVTKNDFIWGWTGDFTQWDAQAYYRQGTSPQPGGMDYYRQGMDLAQFLCKYCPSAEDVRLMLGSGVYWDTYHGPEWHYFEWTYTTGLWVKKKGKWGTEKTERVAPLPEATPTVRLSGDYIFLPASGIISPLYGNGVDLPGYAGYYWTNTPYNDDEAYNLFFDHTNARLDHRSREMGFTLWTFWE